jgi:hypothetical protein
MISMQSATKDAFRNSTDTVSTPNVGTLPASLTDKTSPTQEAAMNAYDSDRAKADAVTDPSMESWLYRSEGFAEDLDELVPAVLTQTAATTHRARPGQSILRWPSGLSAGWRARPLGAR